MGTRVIFASVEANALYQAVCEVAAASLKIANAVCSTSVDQDEDEDSSDTLTERLISRRSDHI